MAQEGAGAAGGDAASPYYVIGQQEVDERRAFEGDYSVEEIKKYLGIFLRRFMTQQFKRNCVPDGPKVGIIGLSNLSWANQRANLCIYLDKSLGDEVARELSSSIIDTLKKK